jgi:single-strand DNA-binding protein
MNQITLVGRLAADPEPPSQDGRPVKFTVVTDEYNSSTKQREAEFHRCVAWGKTGEVLTTYAQKGRQVRVTGRNKTRTWDDDKHGQTHKHYSTEIIVNEVELLGDRPTSRASSEEEPTSW